MSSDKLVAWSQRLLPLLIIAGLLIPGDAWIAQEIRTFAGLITVLILPGYAMARGLRLFDRFDNWLDALSLSVALTWSVGLLLWLAFFFPERIIADCQLCLAGGKPGRTDRVGLRTLAPRRLTTRLS